MKPLLISNSDSNGGAFRASHRLLLALRASSLEAKMLVTNKKTDHFFIDSPKGLRLKALKALAPRVDRILQKLQGSDNGSLHSGNWTPSSLSKLINLSNSDVVNLHWINGETLSIPQVGRIRKPVVMTLHDMWAFCGTEHYVDDVSDSRFRVGYRRKSEKARNGVDLDCFFWKLKKKHWVSPFCIVTPSSWLSSCAKESEIFRGWPIFTIPNALDTSVYQPLDKSFCRHVLGLPQGVPLIGFGAIGGGGDTRKGFDLLSDALNIISNYSKKSDIECAIFGQNEPKKNLSIRLPLHFLGVIHDDATLALLYNAIDVMVVPSRQENLPQTATEAHSCGTPVVAFNTTGVPDVVSHKRTGYLASAFEVEDLVAGILWVLKEEERRRLLGQAAREKAVKEWSYDVVAPQYINLYSYAIRGVFHDRDN